LSNHDWVGKPRVLYSLWAVSQKALPPLYHPTQHGRTGAPPQELSVVHVQLCTQRVRRAQLTARCAAFLQAARAARVRTARVRAKARCRCMTSCVLCQ
jgi:hypothetical protein